MYRQKILFFNEDISYTFKRKLKIRHWINNTILSEGRHLTKLNLIFCSDEYLLKINQDYLNHNTYTDIITFDNSEDDEGINGDIFISIDRVRENAGLFNVSETTELYRVIIHGVLHLLGYKDKSGEDKKIMTAKEDHYLSLLGG